MKQNVDDLRRARRAAADEMAAHAAAIMADEQALATADAAQADALRGKITASEASFAGAKLRFDAANGRVAMAEATEAAQAAAAAQGDLAAGLAVPGSAVPGSVPLPAAPQNPAHRGLDLGMTVIALALAGGKRDGAVAILDREGFSGLSATLNTGTDSAGGVLVPRPMADAMIELLRPRVVVRASGARAVPMPAGQLRYARQSGAATATYGAENSAVLPSEPTTDKIDQTFKKLRGLVPVSNSLLKFGTQMAAMVRDDLVQVMALREDLAFLRGDGTSNSPTGIKSWVPVANWQTAVANDLATVDLALRRLVSKVVDANVPMASGGWIMRASTREFLASLRTTQGVLAYPSIDANATLFGYPIRTTSQIPNNLGAGANQTEVYFADFSQVLIGDASVLELAVSTEAAYVDGSGVWRSAYQNDETLMRAVSQHDLAPAQAAALAGLTGVQWSL